MFFPLYYIIGPGKPRCRLRRKARCLRHRGRNTLPRRSIIDRISIAIGGDAIETAQTGEKHGDSPPAPRVEKSASVPAHAPGERGSGGVERPAQRAGRRAGPPDPQAVYRPSGSQHHFAEGRRPGGPAGHRLCLSGPGAPGAERRRGGPVHPAGQPAGQRAGGGRPGPAAEAPGGPVPHQALPGLFGHPLRKHLLRHSAAGPGRAAGHHQGQRGGPQLRPGADAGRGGKIQQRAGY